MIISRNSISDKGEYDSQGALKIYRKRKNDDNGQRSKIDISHQTAPIKQTKNDNKEEDSYASVDLLHNDSFHMPLYNLPHNFLLRPCMCEIDTLRFFKKR